MVQVIQWMIINKKIIMENEVFLRKIKFRGLQLSLLTSHIEIFSYQVHMCTFLFTGSTVVDKV